MAAYSCARTAPLNLNDSQVVMPSAATATMVATRLATMALSMNVAHPRSCSISMVTGLLERIPVTVIVIVLGLCAFVSACRGAV